MQEKPGQVKKPTISVSINNNNIFSRLKKFYKKICTRIDNKKKLTEYNLKHDFLVISLRDNCIYLNNEKLIDKKSLLQQAILKILLKQHLSGYIDATSQGLNTLQILDLLDDSKSFQTDEPDKQIKQAIFIIKKKVATLYGKKIGEKFILSSKYSGQYRLGRNVTLVCV